MLSFLLPPPSTARTSSQLVKRLWNAKVTQSVIGNRHVSTAIQHPHRTGRSEEDTEDIDERSEPAFQPRHNAAFSHFFDKRTPQIEAAPTYDGARISHEIIAAARRAVASFRKAIATRSPTEIIEAYENLVRAQQRHARDVLDSTSGTIQDSDVGFPIRKNDIQTAIRYLAQRGQIDGFMDARSVKASQQMFHDMAHVFGFRIGPTNLHRQLQTYCLSTLEGHDPCEAFRKLRARYPDWQTSSVEWNMVVSYYVRRQRYRTAKEVWNEMMDKGVPPEAHLRNTMIRMYLELNDIAGAEAQLKTLKAESDQLGIDTLTVTVQGLCNLVSGGDEKDQTVMAKLRSYAVDLRKTVVSKPDGRRDRVAWHALLHYEAIVSDPAHVLETARQARASVPFDDRTLSLLLRIHADELNDLQTSDEALELLERILSAIDPQRTIRPDDQCYNMLMLGLLNNGLDSASEPELEASLLQNHDADLSDDIVYSREDQSRSLPTPNQIREAQLLYDHIRSIGVPPTPLLVTPLLTAYCEAFLPSLPSAMKLVQDILDHRSSTYRSARQRSSSAVRNAAVIYSEEIEEEIEMDIIRPVLDACVKLEDISCVRNLLSRLHNAGIAISATNKAHLMRQLIGITTSWPEAFHIYRSLTRFPSSPSSVGSRARVGALNERGYINLLDSLRKLSFKDPEAEGDASVMPAPPEELLGIVEDMRAAGHRPSCAIYTSLLDYYAKFPTPSYEGVRATHEMLKRDEGLEPDMALINALMNAYNRVDEPAVVLAIWDNLLATRQEIDGITMSVFFDTAGRHGLLSLARKAIPTIRRIEAEANTRGGYRRSAMSKGAWDSWLECLARCGRLEEAVEIAFGEMRKTLLREAVEAGNLEGSEGTSVAELVVRSTQAPIKDKRGRIVGPDAKTLGTLLKFAVKERDRRQRRFLPTSFTGSSSAEGTSLWHRLRARIREELSWLYPAVKSIGENAV